MREIHGNAQAVEFVLPGDRGAQFCNYYKRTGRTRYCDPERAGAGDKRVIHTSADFGYADTLTFRRMQWRLQTPDPHRSGYRDRHKYGALRCQQKVLEAHGGMARCFMADEEVAGEAKERKVTRAVVSMEHAAKLDKPVIFAIGNAPTALIRLYELICDGIYRPAFIIGVPVGFVNGGGKGNDPAHRCAMYREPGKKKEAAMWLLRSVMHFV